uniref:F-box domain-containing protein n=1 Tax=Arundo donax TaxID=35708 RepID=A0A0A8XVP1_ARUDO
MDSSPPLNLVVPQNQDEDRISVLPDHILLDILERLDLHEAIQASTLARRWAHLPRSLSRLLIDVAHFLPHDRNKRKTWTIDQIMTAYTAAVRRLLPLSPSSSNRVVLKELQLSFYLTDPYLHSIGCAVGDVMELGNTIICLEFTIWADVHRPSFEQCVLFGERLMSFFRACSTAFRWITRLILDNIAFGDSNINDLLNSCSKLEFLSLTYCDSASSAVTGDEGAILKIDVPHSALLALEIHTCGWARVDLIQAPKLGRLVCTDWIGANPPLSFGNVPRLHNITLCSAALEWQTPFALSHCLSNTTTLLIMYLNFLDQMIWIEPEDRKHISPVFSNMREVYLYNIFYECDLNWTMFVLEAAPSLNNLYLKLSRHPCERNRCENSAKKVNVLWDQASPDFKHHRLSLLEIVGFAVDERITKYIRLVMERAVSLKRIRLLDQEPCTKCDTMDDVQSPSPLRWRFPVEEEEKKLIRQQLVDGSSSFAEICIG